MWQQGGNQVMAKKKEVATTPEVKTNKATISDFEVIIEPLITEKSTTATSENNKFTFIVKKGANKVQIRNAIKRIYGVTVTEVNTVNVPSKTTTRGSRYKGTISGFKKAIVTIKEGETINIFAE